MVKANFIPWGETLKSLVSQTKCTATTINDILRERGLFCASSDKVNTVPSMINSLLSPAESYELLNSIKTKENLDKVNFRTYAVKQDCDLLDLVSGLMETEDLQSDDLVNYEVEDFNDFTSLDGTSPNALILDFEVCRKDILDDWHQSVKFFKGSVEIKKCSDSKNGISISVKQNHSSPETKEVADKVISIVEKSLIDDGVIDEPKQGGRVLFDDFTNENRIKFLNNLASQHTGYEFYHKTINDFNFTPDKDQDTTKLKHDTNLLEKDINRLRVSGDLENIITVKWKHIHPYIKATKVVATYTVHYESYSGECKVSYEFSDYNKRKLVNPELCINFANLKLKGAPPSVIHDVQSIIMREIETRKNELLVKYKNP